MKGGGDNVSAATPATSGELCPPAPLLATYCTTTQEPVSSANGYTLSTEDGLPRIMKGESFVTHGEPVLVREEGKAPRIVMPSSSVFFNHDSTEPSDALAFALYIAKLMTHLKLAASGDLAEHCGGTTGVVKGTVNVSFTGMADTTGSDPYNRELSRRRYLAVTSRIKAIIRENPNSLRAPYGVNFYAFAAGEQPARSATKGNTDNVDDPRYRRVDAAISTGPLPPNASWERIDSIPAVDAPPEPPQERVVIHDGVMICDMTTGLGPGKVEHLSTTEPIAIMYQGALQTIHPWRVVAFDDKGKPTGADALENALYAEIREARDSTGFMKTCAADVVENYKGVKSVYVDIVVGGADPALVTYAQGVKQRLEKMFPNFAEVTISFQPANDTTFPKRSVAIRPTVQFKGDAGTMGAWYAFEPIPPQPIELIDVETVTP
ncbi:MAG: hypothetical protein HY465_02205 [Deltaproteobacteria bacterium]|nr:hypothetical protein [Deltaproteobacteria bacterium]